MVKSRKCGEKTRKCDGKTRNKNIYIKIKNTRKRGVFSKNKTKHVRHKKRIRMSGGG